MGIKQASRDIAQKVNDAMSVRGYISLGFRFPGRKHEIDRMLDVSSLIVDHLNYQLKSVAHVQDEAVFHSASTLSLYVGVVGDFVQNDLSRFIRFITTFTMDLNETIQQGSYVRMDGSQAIDSTDEFADMFENGITVSIESGDITFCSAEIEPDGTVNMMAFPDAPNPEECTAIRELPERKPTQNDTFKPERSETLTEMAEEYRRSVERIEREATQKLTAVREEYIAREAILVKRLDKSEADVTRLRRLLAKKAKRVAEARKKENAILREGRVIYNSEGKSIAVRATSSVR